MDHDRLLKYLTVLYWLGSSDHDAVISWAEQEFSQNPDPHPLLADIFGGHTDVGQLLSEIAFGRLGFAPASTDGESFAKAILASSLRQFLAREISPHELCQLVWAIDNKYLDASPREGQSVAYYPQWLGDLWNACDWCDETWGYSSAPQLVSKAQAVLNSLADGPN